jgi:hypothetical protein
MATKEKPKRIILTARDNHARRTSEFFPQWSYQLVAASDGITTPRVLKSEGVHT